jgi:ATP phosphoribosyltransferase regulatory subunit
MMKNRVERLRGMHDLLPEAYQQQNWLTDHLRVFLGRAGYIAVDTPILERSDLFLASFGQDLWQNLYAFRLHNRDLCLRPEYTASICRLYLDHYQQLPLPVRLQYAGPIFRYEAPGRNRFRQHTQLGIEVFGGQAAAADAEMLLLACDVLRELRIASYRLELGHIGVASGFIHRLQLDDHAARLLLSLMEQISRSSEGERLARERLEALYPPGSVAAADGKSAPGSAPSNSETTRHITSLLNGISVSFGDEAARHEVVERYLWKMGRNEQRRQILYALEFLRALHAVAGPPPAVFGELRELLERYELDPAPLLELEELVALLEQCGVPGEQVMLNLALGRGVSYYTGLVFEIHARDDGGYAAQLCGGGRYDRLMRAVGSGRDIHACGFAFGVERLLALVPQSELPRAAEISALVIPVHLRDVPYALQVARSARLQGIASEVDLSGHGVAAGLKQAAKKRLPLAFIVGESEQQAGSVTVKNLESGEERHVRVPTLLEHIAGREQHL